MIDLDPDFEYPEDKHFARTFWTMLAGNLVLAVFVATLIVEGLKALVERIN